MRNYFRRLAEGYETGFLAKLLTPLMMLAELLYATTNRTARFLYEKNILKQKSLSFPVISVGNLTWGGTGKTPFVEYLARKICDRRRTPLVLIRGYSHDEVNQLKRQLPKALIGAGKDRYSVATQMEKEKKIGAAILDDGFQHFPIKRNLEIVMVNALNPFGNGHLIPRGILREPLEVLKRAQVIVISHSNLISKEELVDLKKELRSLSPKTSFVDSYLEPLFFYRAQKRSRVFIERLKDKKVTTFSGIGTPRSFRMLLTQKDIKPARNFEFSDHHSYSRSDLKEIKKISESSSSAEIITTEKDYYRNPKMIAEELNPLILATRMRIASGEGMLNDQVFHLLGIRRRR